MAHSSQADLARDSAGTSQSPNAVAALAQIRVALQSGGDARALFERLRRESPRAAQAVAHALAAGGAR